MSELEVLVVGKQPGQWRRKGDNGPPMVTDPNGGDRLLVYSRPSNFGKQVENTFNLQRWQQRQGVIGMMLEPSLADEMRVLWARDGHDTVAWKTAVDDIYVRAAKAAGAMVRAERGGHGHVLTEDNDLGRSIVGRLEVGEDLGLPTAVQERLIEAWQGLVEEYFDVLAVEQPCIYDHWRVAGTLDRIVRLRRDVAFEVGRDEIMIPAGTVIVADVKTGGLRTDRFGVPTYWLSYAVQVAAYANAVPYDVDAERRGTWDWPVDTTHAVIAHLDIGGALDTGVMAAQLFYVDLVAGHQAGELVCAAKVWQRRNDVFSRADAHCVTLTVDPAPRVRSGGASLPSAAPPVDRQMVTERARALVDAGHGRVLTLTWPEGVPGLRTDHTHTDDELVQVLVAIRRVEDSTGMPFHPADAPPPAPVPSWISAEPRAAGPIVEEGDMLDAFTIDDLRAEVMALPIEDQQRLDTIAKQAHDAGMPISPRNLASRRRHAIVKALVAWCRTGWDDDIIRDLLASVLDSDLPRHGATPLGAAIGALTIDEANRLADLARQLDDGAGLEHRDRWTVASQLQRTPAT